MPHGSGVRSLSKSNTHRRRHYNFAETISAEELNQLLDHVQEHYEEEKEENWGSFDADLGGHQLAGDSTFRYVERALDTGRETDEAIAVIGVVVDEPGHEKASVMYDGVEIVDASQRIDFRDGISEEAPPEEVDDFGHALGDAYHEIIG